MIGPKLVNAAARPFYNRSLVVIPITWTGLGAFVFNPPGGLITNIGPFALGALETIIVDVSYISVSLGAIVQVDVNGLPLNQHNTQLYGATLDNQSEVWSLGMNGTAIPAATVHIDFTPGGVTPTSVCVTLSRVTGLRQPNAFDKGSNGAGNSANPASALTPLITVPNEYVHGNIASVGNAGDLLGAWQNGLAAGQRASTAANAVDLKQGWKVVNAIAQQQAAIVGATARRWGAMCCTFRSP